MSVTAAAKQNLRCHRRVGHGGAVARCPRDRRLVGEIGQRLRRETAGWGLRLGVPVADALAVGEGERLSAVGHWRRGHQERSASSVDVLPGDRVTAIGEVLRAAIEAGMTDEQAHRLAGQLRAHSDSARLASELVRTFASAARCRPS